MEMATVSMGMALNEVQGTISNFGNPLHFEMMSLFETLMF